MQWRTSLEHTEADIKVRHQAAFGIARPVSGGFQLTQVFLPEHADASAAGVGRRSMFTVSDLQQMDPGALELQLLVAQRAEPLDETFLRDVVTAINLVALRGCDDRVSDDDRPATATAPVETRAGVELRIVS